MKSSTDWWKIPNLIQTLRAEFGDELTKKYLRAKFADPKNKLIFGNVCFPHHFISKSPEFHKEMLEAFSLPENVARAAPRGFAKSTIIMVDNAFDIVNSYRHYIVEISDSYTQALEHITTLQFELEYNPILKWLYGELKTSNWAQGEFITSTDVKVVAKGQGMKVRGLKYKQYRPDKVVIDDLENDELVANMERRNKLYRWFKMGVLPALSRNGKINYVGTILHTDSLLARIVNKEGEFGGWNTRVYSGIQDDGNSLWPDMWPIDELIGMRDNPKHPHYLGSHVFSQEIQNKPVNEIDSVIKRAWIKYQDNLPAMKCLVISVDPAISKNETADPTAIQAWGLGIDENVYAIEKINARLSFNETGHNIRAMYHRIKQQFKDVQISILIEEVSYQKALKENDKLKDLPVLGITPDKDKRTRLIVVSKWWEAGQVFVKSTMDSLVDQVVGFGSTAHDDEMDAATMAIFHLKEESDRLNSSDIFFA